MNDLWKKSSKEKRQVKIFICQYYLPVIKRTFCVQNCIEDQLLHHPFSASKHYPFVHMTGFCNLKALKFSSLLSAKVNCNESTKSFLVKLLIRDFFYLVGSIFLFFPTMSLWLKEIFTMSSVILAIPLPFMLDAVVSIL